MSTDNVEYFSAKFRPGQLTDLVPFDDIDEAAAEVAAYHRQEAMAALQLLLEQLPTGSTVPAHGIAALMALAQAA